MSSKIRKMDTEKLKKYLRIINICYSILLIVLIAIMIFSVVLAIRMRIDGLEMSIAEPILAVISIAVLALIFDKISNKILSELSYRKNEETTEILSFGAKKIKLNDFSNIEFEELLEDAELEAQYDDENNVIYVRVIITDDDSCTKISKRVKFARDDIISAIEII